jgi:hypothetical protein
VLVICPTSQVKLPATQWHDGQITSRRRNAVKQFSRVQMRCSVLPAMSPCLSSASRLLAPTKSALGDLAIPICEFSRAHGHGKCRALWASDFPVVALLTDPTSSKSIYRALDLQRLRPPMTVGRGGVNSLHCCRSQVLAGDERIVCRGSSTRL